MMVIAMVMIGRGAAGQVAFCPLKMMIVIFVLSSLPIKVMVMMVVMVIFALFTSPSIIISSPMMMM